MHGILINKGNYCPYGGIPLHHFTIKLESKHSVRSATPCNMNSVIRKFNSLLATSTSAVSLFCMCADQDSNFHPFFLHVANTYTDSYLSRQWKEIFIPCNILQFLCLLILWTKWMRIK